MKQVLIGCLLIASYMGCQKKAAEQTPPDAAPPLPPPVVSTVQDAAAPVPEVDAAIPVQEDFEKKAKATVTKPTYKQEIDKLDKEIGKE